jgi:hypothetical protein
VQRSAFGYVCGGNWDKLEKAGDCYPVGGESKPQMRGPRPSSDFRAGLAAGAVAGLLSGIPSTLHALLTGRDPLAAAVAAGNLLIPTRPGPGATGGAQGPIGALTATGGAEVPAENRWRFLLAGGVAHVVLSLGWGTVLAVAVRRTSLSPVIVGLAGGAAIAAIDLGLLAHGPAGRRWPLIRALPVGPQVADHLAFGAIAGAVLRRG